MHKRQAHAQVLGTVRRRLRERGRRWLCLATRRGQEQVHLLCVDAPLGELLGHALSHVRHVRAALKLQLGKGLLLKGGVADALDEGVGGLNACGERKEEG